MIDYLSRCLITTAEASIDRLLQDVNNGGRSICEKRAERVNTISRKKSKVKGRRSMSPSELNRFAFWYNLNKVAIGRNDLRTLEVPKKQTYPTRSSTGVHAPNEFEHASIFISLSVYFTWFVLLLYASLRELLRYYGLEENKSAVEIPSQRHFAPLLSSLEPVYARNCYMRVRDVFERPIGGVPGARVALVDRYTEDYCWSFKFTGRLTSVINVGSYNYLGFAENDGPCSRSASEAITHAGLSMASTVNELGMTAVQARLEHLVAEFLGMEEAICFSMGFATNSMNIACLTDSESLIVSDQHNHASLIVGCRASPAAIKVFRHNDVKSLEKVLREAVVKGNPKTRRPYNKILIVVEGIYSMEGSICNLPAIVTLKKKYKCYLYLDEAHSIGAMGATGRGITEYWGVPTSDIDIMMGTFTKSFGSAGGYLAGSKKIIQHLRRNSPTAFYSAPMSPPIAQQIYTSMSMIMGRQCGRDGADRLERLARNVKYFRRQLKHAGFIVYGSDDSPVVPIMLYYPTKCGLWGREMLARGVGVVVVSFPATAMNESRCRICLSAAHTKQMLDEVLEAINEVGDLSCTKHSSKKRDQREIDPEGQGGDC